MITILGIKEISHSEALEFVEKNPNNIRKLTASFHTKEVGIAVARANPNLLVYINNNDEDITLQAVEVDGLSIRYRLNNLTDKIKKAAIKQNYRALRIIGSLQTEDDAHYAVTINGFALKYVIDKKEYIQLEAVRTTPEAIVIIDNIEVQFRAIIENPDIIKLIKPFKFNLSSMLLDFDYNYYHLLPLVNKPVANKAFAINKELFQYIPNHLKTTQMYIDYEKYCNDKSIVTKESNKLELCSICKKNTTINEMKCGHYICYRCTFNNLDSRKYRCNKCDNVITLNASGNSGDSGNNC